MFHVSQSFNGLGSKKNEMLHVTKMGLLILSGSRCDVKECPACCRGICKRSRGSSERLVQLFLVCLRKVRSKMMLGHSGICMLSVVYFSAKWMLKWPGQVVLAVSCLYA